MTTEHPEAPGSEPPTDAEVLRRIHVSAARAADRQVDEAHRRLRAECGEVGDEAAVAVRSVADAIVADLLAGPTATLRAAEDPATRRATLAVFTPQETGAGGRRNEEPRAGSEPRSPLEVGHGE